MSGDLPVAPAEVMQLLDELRRDAAETMYFVSAPATDSWQALSEDAERRARQRGCQCIRPTFIHLVDDTSGVITCTVIHDEWCPSRRGS